MMHTPGSSGPTPMGRKLRRLGADVAASSEELREFVQRFRGKSPQEVLGLVAQSGLVRATGTAAVGCAILVAVFTVLPYAWGRAFGRTASSKPAPAASHAAQQQTPAGSPAQTAGSEPAQAADAPAVPEGKASAVSDAAGQPAPPESEAILEKLNMDTEPADPNVNPLEDASDDLLDDLK